jgi:cyclophilin family peptidyl-prolyl cis-trans isomerase
MPVLSMKPNLISLAALVLSTMIAAQDLPEPELQSEAANPLPSISIVLNGRSTDVPVESLDNPLVLLQTNRGDMVLELFPGEAPATVAHFLGLADGSKAFIDQSTGLQVMRPFYEGLGFHRIVSGFIIQGGSPDGSPTGNPGIVIADEINALSLGLDRMMVLDAEGSPNPILGIRSEDDFRNRVLAPLYGDMKIADAETLRARSGQVRERLKALTVKELYEMEGYRYNQRVRSRPPVAGSLGMANHGPGTTGSQFFITLSDTDWLTGRYNFFGRIRAGDNVLETIARTRVDDNNRPVEEITIFSVTRIKTEAL